MAAENVVNNTEHTSYDKLNTLAIFHAVRAAQWQLQQQNINVDVSHIWDNILGSNRDHDFFSMFQSHN